MQVAQGQVLMSSCNWCILFLPWCPKWSFQLVLVVVFHHIVQKLHLHSSSEGVSYWLSKNVSIYRDWWWSMYPMCLEADKCWPGLLECHGIPLLVPIRFPSDGFSVQLLDRGHHPYISTGCGGTLLLHLFLSFLWSTSCTSWRLNPKFLEHMSHVDGNFLCKYTNIRTHVQIWQFLIDYTAMHI